MNLAEGLTLEIDGHPTEFGRDRKFEVFARGPESGNNNNTGVLLVVHDRYQQAGHPYFQSLRRDWADRYNLVVAGVNYLGTGAYSSPAWRVEIPEPIAKLLMEMIPEPSRKEYIIDGKPDLIKILGFYRGRTLQGLPPGAMVINDSQKEDDYWDFGLVQAIDIIYTLKVIREVCRQNSVPINDKRTIVYGSGEGGHVAQMCGRLAPNSFALVVDHAGKVFIPPREMVPVESMNFKSGRVPIYDITMPLIYPQIYSLKEGSRFPVTHDMLQIRNLTRCIPETGCKYVMISHGDDKRVSESSRQFLAECMGEAGIDVHHHDTGKVTGNNYEVDIKELFEQYCTQLVKEDSEESVCRKGDSDFDMKSRITYETANGGYVIDYSDFVPRLWFEGEVKTLSPSEIV